MSLLTDARQLLKFRKLFNLPDRLRTLEERIATLELQKDHLRFEIELSRSASEVDESSVLAFAEWKALNRVPKTPLVSVCIGTYNRAELLVERALPSILRQSYKNIEVIVVGDGCTDDTAVRVARIDDSRLHFVNLNERGNYPTNPVHRWLVAGTAPMNASLRLARGDYITHLDDDDEHLPDRVEKLLEFAKDTQCDLVWHPFWYEATPGQWRHNDCARFACGSVTTGSVFYRHWLKNVEWNDKAYLVGEPGDWNRMRRISYLGADCRRYSESLLRHYRERANS